MAKRYYWLKLEKDYLSSPKIKKLRKIAGGDTYTVIYLKMLLLSIEKCGVIDYQGIEPTFEEELALILDEDSDNVRVTLSFLLSQGLIFDSEDGSFMLPEAANRIGTESESKERVQAYRQRKAIRENIPLTMVKKLSNEQILLSDGNTKFIDNKRYGGNAEYVYELAECKCELCGETNTKSLVIHHNNGNSNDLEDLYLLCHSCHKKVENGKIKKLEHKRKDVTCNTYVTGSNTYIDIDKKKEKEKDIYNTSENHQHLSCERYEDEVFPNQLKLVEHDNFSNTNIREDTDRYAYVEDNNIYTKADFPQNGKNGKKRLTSQILQEIIQNWNNLGIGKVRDIRANTRRHKRIKGIIDDYGYDDLIAVMNTINDSPFLKGENSRNWKITMDWFLEPNNYQKVRDGNYINNNNVYSKSNPEQNNSAIDMFSSK